MTSHQLQAYCEALYANKTLDEAHNALSRAADNASGDVVTELEMARIGLHKSMQQVHNALSALRAGLKVSE